MSDDSNQDQAKALVVLKLESEGSDDEDTEHLVKRKLGGRNVASA
jgi:hypothetical protein